MGFLSRLSRPGPNGKVRRYVFPIQSGEAGLRFVAASEAFLLCPQRRMCVSNLKLSTLPLRVGWLFFCGARSGVPGLRWLYLQRQHCKHRLHSIVCWSSKGIGNMSSQLIFVVVHHQVQYTPHHNVKRVPDGASPLVSKGINMIPR